MTVLEYLTAYLDPEEMAEIRELFRQVMGTIVVLFDALSPASLATLLDQSKETIAWLLGKTSLTPRCPGGRGQAHPASSSLIPRISTGSTEMFQHDVLHRRQGGTPTPVRMLSEGYVQLPPPRYV